MRHSPSSAGMLAVGAVLLPALAAAAAVNSDELARCAAIASGATRLACYDALAHRADAAPAGVSAAAPSIPIPPAAAAPMAPAAAAAPDAAESFGLSAVQRHVAVVGPKQQSARIVSLAENQTGHAIVVLDNGQTWTVLDNDGFLSNNVQVTIKRAALGSYLMMTPSHHSYRVHRDK